MLPIGFWRALSTIIWSSCCTLGVKIWRPCCKSKNGWICQMRGRERTSNPSAAESLSGFSWSEKRTHLWLAKLSQCHVRCLRVGLLIWQKQVISVLWNFESMQPSTPAPVSAVSRCQVTWSRFLLARERIWRSGNWLFSRWLTRLSTFHIDQSQLCWAKPNMDWNESVSKLIVPWAVIKLPCSPAFHDIWFKRLAKAGVIYTSRFRCFCCIFCHFKLRKPWSNAWNWGCTFKPIRAHTKVGLLPGATCPSTHRSIAEVNFFTVFLEGCVQKLDQTMVGMTSEAVKYRLHSSSIFRFNQIPYSWKYQKASLLEARIPEQ